MSGTVVKNGGQEVIEDGGIASGTVVYGTQLVNGGTAIGTLVKSGGQEVIENCGIASGTVVNSGGGSTSTTIAP